MRPHVHRVEVERAIDRIAKRRKKVEDRNRHRLPDALDSDPTEILDYLRKYTGQDIPRWVRQADVCDALTLNNWLWWEDRRRELHFLRAGRREGLFLSQLGAQVGVGKQGVIDRIDRLEALLRYDRPDEKLTRAHRQAQRGARELRPAQDRWLESHRRQLSELVNALVRHATRYELVELDREWIDQLQIDVRNDDLTPASMAILGLAVADLRTAPAVLALSDSRPHGIHAALMTADHLRSSFASLGVEKKPDRATDGR